MLKRANIFIRRSPPPERERERERERVRKELIFQRVGAVYLLSVLTRSISEIALRDRQGEEKGKEEEEEKKENSRPSRQSRVSMASKRTV